jgi:broad specificity phosphatase PhoE
MLQECSAMPCDRGSARETLESEWPHLDFSALEDDWNHKTGQYAADEQSLQRRAADVRKWLQGRPEQEIVVVTHGSFLRHLVFGCVHSIDCLWRYRCDVQELGG